jgi:hypothetical protein
MTAPHEITLWRENPLCDYTASEDLIIGQFINLFYFWLSRTGRSPPLSAVHPHLKRISCEAEIRSINTANSRVGERSDPVEEESIKSNHYDLANLDLCLVVLVLKSSTSLWKSYLSTHISRHSHRKERSLPEFR